MVLDKEIDKIIEKAKDLVPDEYYVLVKKDEELGLVVTNTFSSFDYLQKFFDKLPNEEKREYLYVNTFVHLAYVFDIEVNQWVLIMNQSEKPLKDIQKPREMRIWDYVCDIKEAYKSFREDYNQETSLKLLEITVKYAKNNNVYTD